MELTFNPWWFAYPIVTIALLIMIALIARVRPGRGRRTALVTHVLVTTIYLVWRTLFTLPLESPVAFTVGLILLITEFLGAIQTFLFAIALWRPVTPTRIPLPSQGPYPTVDILITTVNEPVSTLRATLAAAANIRYPGHYRVFLCDDGNRAELRELAAQFGATHVTRVDRAYAKAGNLNHALTQTTGELIVTLDADMIPRENLLEASVGLFMADPALGLAQAPQAFHNEDPFQYNLFSGGRLPNEQDFFMREIQGGYERFNATMYVGSNAVFRRSAIESIGGFVTGGLTEDFATGVLFQAKHIRIAFIGEIIAAGLAAEDVADLMKQRDRWARGAIQCGRRFNVFTLDGLSVIQRLIYANRILYWYFGVFKFIYAYTPLLFLLFAVPALVTDIWHLALFWVPYYIASLTSFTILSGGRRSFTWSHIYELAMAPTLAVSVLTESVGLSNTNFVVTPKGVARSTQAFHWRIALPHLIFLLLACAGAMNVLWWSRDRIPLDAAIIPLIWTAYNMAGSLMAIFISVQRPRHRATERTVVDLAVTASLATRVSAALTLTDLSLSGAQGTLEPVAETIEVGDELLVHLPANGVLPDAVEEVSAHSAPGHAGSVANEVPERALRCTVMRVDRTHPSDRITLGLRFEHPSPTDERAIMSLITNAPAWVRHDREEHANLFAIGTVAARGISRTTSRRPD